MKPRHPRQVPPRCVNKRPCLARPRIGGKLAEWYDALVGDDGSEYQREVILPGVLRMLDIKKDTQKHLAILDLACGQESCAANLPHWDTASRALMPPNR